MNLTWITDALAVGGCFSCESVETLAVEHRVRAVVDLRAEACDDEVLLRSHGIAFLHLPTADLCAVDDDALDRGVAFVSAQLAAGRRTLVHCQHGIGRSALLALCVLVDGGFAPLDALERAKSRRAVVSPSPAQYEAWIAWLRRHRDVTRWELPDFDRFAAIAYRHVRGADAGVR